MEGKGREGKRKRRANEQAKTLDDDEKNTLLSSERSSSQKDGSPSYRSTVPSIRMRMHMEQ